jgi:hypothetical protein
MSTVWTIARTLTSTGIAVGGELDIETLHDPNRTRSSQRD